MVTDIFRVSRLYAKYTQPHQLYHMPIINFIVVFKLHEIIEFFSVTLQPPVGQGLFITEAS